MMPERKNEYVNAAKKAETGKKCMAAVCACGLAASIFVLSSCFGGNAAAQAAFDRGAKAYDECDMEAAKMAFAECCKLDGGLYENAKQYLDGIAKYESLYTEGVSAYENSDYNTAASAFLGIKNYLNSSEYLSKIDSLKEDYDKAVKLYENGDFIASREAFVQLGNYGESSAYIENLDAMIGLYNEGVKLINRRSYTNATKAFNAIKSSFLDSDELLELCDGEMNNETVKLGEYIYNYNAEYNGDIRIVSGNSGILFDMKDSRGMVICGAMDETGIVRYISFCASSELRAKLGADELKGTFAHCIRALSPRIAEYSEILSNIDEYFIETGKSYGCMRVHRGVGVDGITVLTAEYEP